MRVQRAAREFSYPSTPDIAAATRAGLQRKHSVTRPWVRAIAAILLAILAGMVFVPEIRAGVLEFLRIGAVRIFFDPSAAPATDAQPAPTFATPTVALNRDALDAAERALDSPILLPSYPPEVGLPDSLTIVDTPLTLITFIWNTGDEAGSEAQLVLQMIGARTEVRKYGVPDAVQVSVNGELGVWLDTPHDLEIRDTSGRSIALSWLVQFNVLVWMENSITYRLETDLPLTDAILIAESLQPVDLE